MTIHEYEYGTTLGGMQPLRDIGIKASPLAGFRQYSVAVRLGDGTLQGHGFPIITWHWNFISVAERAVFVDSLNGALSGTAFIRTRLPDNTWADFETVINVPIGEENLQVGFIIGFDLTFTYCSLIP